MHQSELVWYLMEINEPAKNAMIMGHDPEIGLERKLNQHKTLLRCIHLRIGSGNHNAAGDDNDIPSKSIFIPIQRYYSYTWKKKKLFEQVPK